MVDSSKLKEYMDSFGSDGSVTHHRHAGLFTKFVVEFSHAASGDTVTFPATIQEFSDNYQSNWDVSEYYGRMDPVAHFRSTQRVINFSLTIQADDTSDAATNLLKFQRLTRFLYPSYRSSPDPSVSGHGNANLINAAPLIGIKMGNLISNAKNKGAPLLGRVDGFEFRPDQEATWFLADGMDDADGRGLQSFTDEQGTELILADWAQPIQPAVEGTIYLPSRFELACTFNPLHEHPLGFDEGGQWMGASGDFPYHMDKIAGAVSDDLKEAAIIQRTTKVVPQAPMVKVIKRGLLDALFGPPK